MKIKIDRAAALFSANSFAAAMLALFIGFSLGLPRPYWAMTTAYIVSQPLSGAVRSKAVYRVAGTLLGAAATVALVPNLVNSPLLLSLALAIWVGGCLAVSLLDRTPRSYVLMLAGYTAAIIGFPSVGAPAGVFDAAVARTVEITLGILCAGLIHSLVFPRPVGAVLSARIGTWLDDADRWALDLLTRRPDGEVDRDRRQLAGAATDIHLLSTHLPFDTSRLRETTAAVRVLHERMLLLVPALSGLSDRLAALRAEGREPGPETAALIDEAAAWIGAGSGWDEAAPLLARLRARADALSPDAAWPALLEVSLTARLHDVVERLRDARAALGHIRERSPLPAPLAAAPDVAAKRRLHRDYGLAALSGLAAAVAVFGVCAAWIGTGWPDGAAAAVMAAVFCCFFASQDDPAPAIANFGLFTLVSLPIAAAYQFAVLPRIDGFPMLAMVLAPTLLALGVFVASPRHAGSAMAVLMGFCNALALQETFNADFAGFLNANLAQFVGLFAAIGVTRLMRSMSVDASARRLLRQTWRNLARQMRRNDVPTPAAFADILVDRLGLLTPKLAAGGGRGDLVGVDALRDLRIGMNLMAIQRARPSLGAAADPAGRLLAAVGDHFAGLAARPGRRQPPPPTLDALDETLRQAVRRPPSPERLGGVSGLIGLRRNLFPDAPAYRADAPEPTP
ncbi:MAG: FUSC family protein [Caulobacteraceae bacterium]|nr:FUSC family protein [Caulobacteraceae bacterium]